MRRLCFATLLAVVSTHVVTFAAELQFASTRDTTLYANDGTFSNGAGPGFIAGTTGGGQVRRGLIMFDVSGIPSGAVITGVALDLYMDRTNIAEPTPSPVALHRLTRAWGEGASVADSPGAGTLAELGDATWTHAVFDTVPWTNEGGDFAAAASATIPTLDVGPYSWSDAGMVSDVQQWLSAPGENFGWILIGDEETPGTAKRFTSHEYSDESLRPRLTITYSIALPGDMNCDGLFNNFDIDPFVLALISPQDYAAQYPGCDPLRGDVNHDNAFNNFDIDPFVNCIVNGC